VPSPLLLLLSRWLLAVNSDTVDLGAIFRVPNMASPLSAKLSLASGNGRFLAMYHGSDLERLLLVPLREMRRKLAVALVDA